MKNSIKKFEFFRIQSQKLQKIKGGDDDASSLGEAAANAANQTQSEESENMNIYRGRMGHF